MKTSRIVAVAALICRKRLWRRTPRLAQQPGIKRTDLQRHDLAVPERAVIQALVEFAPGVATRGTRIRATSSSMSSKACSSISSTASRR